MITTTTSLLSLPGNSSIPTGSAAAKPLTASAKPLTAEQKKKAAMAWDEKIRACLTDIEKDTSHITKHVKVKEYLASLELKQ